MSAPLVVIPCGGAKLPHRAPARELYVGGYFRTCLAYALARTLPGRVRVLSARYGLVTLEQELEPYNVRLGGAWYPGCGVISRHELAWQRDEQGLTGERDVEALGGAAYVAAVCGLWPSARRVVSAGRGIGEQLAELKRLTAALRRAGAPGTVAA